MAMRSASGREVSRAGQAASARVFARPRRPCGWCFRRPPARHRMLGGECARRAAARARKVARPRGRLAEFVGLRSRLGAAPGCETALSVWAAAGSAASRRARTAPTIRMGTPARPSFPRCANLADRRISANARRARSPRGSRWRQCNPGASRSRTPNTCGLATLQSRCFRGYGTDARIRNCPCSVPTSSNVMPATSCCARSADPGRPRSSARACW